MKIVQVHNYYQQAGGEDSVVEAEKKLLIAGGHKVVTYHRNNDGIQGLLQLVFSSFKTVWNFKTYSGFRKLLKKESPDVVHCHNTFPLISPSIYWACSRERVPVVLTLHNYRFLCLNSQLFRSGNSMEPQICEQCVTKSLKLPGILYRCYRDSLAGSVVVASMLFFHRIIGTWSQRVNLYIALTEFQREKMIEGGLPSGKIRVKPNFTRVGEHQVRVNENELTKKYVLFVGRLSPEKGCALLIKAWNKLPSTAGYVLRIIGDGPEMEQLKELNSSCGTDCVEFLGRKTQQEVMKHMAGAEFVVLPSLWYEGFPMTIVEAFSCGTPVIVPSIGGMKYIVDDGVNGLKFNAGDISSLVRKLEWVVQNGDKRHAMKENVKKEFKEKYSDRINCNRLLEIYREAIQQQQRVEYDDKLG